MKEFIINVLTALGFGMYACVPHGAELFAGKMEEMFPTMEFKYEHTDSGFNVIVTSKKDKSHFIIKYKYAEGSKIIGSVEII